MNDQTNIRNTFRVGRFRCTLTLADGALNAEWHPYVPDRMSKAEWQAYRAGRQELLARTYPGKRVGVLEVH